MPLRHEALRSSQKGMVRVPKGGNPEVETGRSSTTKERSRTFQVFHKTPVPPVCLEESCGGDDTEAET